MGAGGSGEGGRRRGGGKEAGPQGAFQREPGGMAAGPERAQNKVRACDLVVRERWGRVGCSAHTWAKTEKAHPPHSPAKRGPGRRMSDG